MKRTAVALVGAGRIPWAAQRPGLRAGLFIGSGVASDVRQCEERCEERIVVDLLWLVGLVIVFGVVLHVWRHLQARVLRLERAGRDYSTFSEHFRGAAPEVVLGGVYGELQKWAGCSDFPVEPGDDLGEVYGIVDEDVWDELKELAKKCKRRPPTEEEASRVVTVRDAVLLLASLEKVGGDEPAA